MMNLLWQAHGSQKYKTVNTGGFHFVANIFEGVVQGYLFSPHYGGKQLFLFSPQGPENGGKIKFFPPRVRNMGGKNLQKKSAPAVG